MDAHGGDVPVQGVACLGTPFLIRARRDDHDPPLEQLLALGSGPFIATLLLALRLMARDVDGLLRPGPFLTVGVAGAVVGLIAMCRAGVLAKRANTDAAAPGTPAQGARRALVDDLRQCDQHEDEQRHDG